jgi:hypothetical protein
MIKRKITKNIIQDNTFILGLTLKQVIMGIVGFAIGLVEIYFLWGKVSINLLMSIVFFTILTFFFFGVIKIQGMSMFKYVFLAFKGVDKRPYCRKGDFSNEGDNTF